jgi:hypothetical protein
LTFASEDLKTLLVAHTFADNVNLSAEPQILLHYEDHPSSHTSSGFIDIKTERKISDKEYTHHRNPTYRVVVIVRYDGTNPTILGALRDEIQSAFDTNNNNVSKTYSISINNFDWSGNVRLGRLVMFVDMIKQWVTI